jgi:two-component system, LytTR family, sensor kinase
LDDHPPVDGPAESDRLKRGAVILLALLWSFHFVIMWFRSQLFDRAGDRLVEGTLKRLAMALLGAFLAYLIYRFVRGLRRGPFARQAWIGATLCIVASALQAIVNMWLFADREGQPWLADFLFYVIFWFWLFFSFTAAFLALSYSLTVQAQERQAAELVVKAQEAQVRALRYQINPHFLFNTLNAIAALVRDAPAKAEEMIVQLSDFFRRSLAVNPMEDLTLKQEVELQRLYLEIERTRFPDRLRFEVDLEEGSAEAKVPALLLQPLVENAVKHGVARSTGPTCIRIGARVDGPMLEIRVDNDALSEGRAASGEKVGLRNVAERLRSRFGEAASLSSGDMEGGGFRNEIRIPLSR